MSTEVTLHQHPHLPASSVRITAEGELGMGSDHSHFVIRGVNINNNPQEGAVPDSRHAHYAQGEFHILFQNGPIPEVGRNGVTLEELLAVCGHRLEELQAGKFANAYNAAALEDIQSAIAALNQRTIDRMDRQVEGTYEK